MSVVRVGATKQYSDNWENIFSGGRRSSSAIKTAVKPARKSAKKSPKAAKKAAGKKGSSGAKRKRK
jgi:hypothetical protein